MLLSGIPFGNIDSTFSLTRAPSLDTPQVTPRDMDGALYQASEAAAYACNA